MQEKIHYPTRSAEDLIAETRGKWGYILGDLAPELDEAIRRAPHHVPCPIHGGTDGFRMYKDYQETGGAVCNTCGPFGSGFKLLAFIKGCDNKAAFAEVGKWMRAETYTPTLASRPKLPDINKYVDFDKAEKAHQMVWLGSQIIENSPVEKYLTSRGIPSAIVKKIRTLRFHPSLKYYDFKEKKDYGMHPGLVAQIKSKEGFVRSVHRIYLTADGLKAQVPDPKRMMSRSGELVGCAIRIVRADRSKILSVTEGIETALAVLSAYPNLPVWSCVSAPLLEAVDIPDNIQTVLIWADKDKSLRGMQAANKLRERVESMGKRAIVMEPPGQIAENSKGIDWLDIWTSEGKKGFPDLDSLNIY